jgi:hypothetical protein
MRAIALVLFVCTLFTPFADALSATSAQVDNARATGLAWLFQNQKGDGSWSAPSGLQVQATSEAVNAFLNAGIQSGDAFYASVANLANAHPASIDGQARQLAALRRTGSDISPFSSQLMSARNVYFGWGSLPSNGSTPTDTGLALLVMLDAVPTYANSDILNGLCTAVLTTQRSGGGWSYQGLGSNAPATAANAAIVPTAYAVLVLQKATARLTGATCNGTAYSLATSIANGVTYLKTKQNSDGGFGDATTSGPLETALAYQAIQAVNATDATLANAQNYLVLTAQQANGSWANDPFQTALVLETFPVVTLADTAKDGVPDFRSTATGATFDITTNTPRSFADHLARPYGNGLNILPYNRPQGFVFP